MNRRSFLACGLTALPVGLAACGGGGGEEPAVPARVDASGVLHVGLAAYAQAPVGMIYREGLVLVTVADGKLPEANEFFAAHNLPAAPASYKKSTYWITVAANLEDQWRRALRDQSFVASAQLYDGGRLIGESGKEAIDSYPAQPGPLVRNGVRFDGPPIDPRATVPGEILARFTDVQSGLALFEGSSIQPKLLASQSYTIVVGRGLENAWIALLKASPFVAYAQSNFFLEWS